MTGVPRMTGGGHGRLLLIALRPGNAGLADRGAENMADQSDSELDAGRAETIQAIQYSRLATHA